MRWLWASGVALAAAFAGTPSAQAATSCTSPNPADWPASAKPYFMIIVDTSGSMKTAVAGANSCGYEQNRMGHARCAVRKTLQAFAGEVNFGLATYAWKLNGSCNDVDGTCANCGNGDLVTPACYPGCTKQYAGGSNKDDNFCGPVVTDTGISAALNSTPQSPTFPFPTLAGTQKIHAGGLITVPIVQDAFWLGTSSSSNFDSIFKLVDNNCGNEELGADSNTPLGGSLFNMYRYFSGNYADPLTGASLQTPIGPATLNGQPAERGCRSINIILLTDGDETCDSYDKNNYPCTFNSTACEGLAVFQANRLRNPGVTVNGQTFSIQTHVIGFAGATKTALDHIAAAGGTGTAYSTANETQLSQALAAIVGGAIKPETCDNTDNNCNGCVDEGFKHYCNVQSQGGCCSWQTPAQKAACGANACACCNWTTTAQRTACLNNYTATITGANPKGDLSLLPCTSAAQAQGSSTWLCYDPGEKCDNLDNNCDSQDPTNPNVDEGFNKCGSPAHCPKNEACNGQDDDCNGLVDEGNVCTNTCAVTASAEVCDGCDNDCDGMTDNGLSVSLPCGFTGPGEPAYCQGTITCKPPQAVSAGLCAPGGGFTSCQFTGTPQTESCNNLDDDCNGVIDDAVPSIDCVPTGAPSGLVYQDTSPNSQCKKGKTQCVNGAPQCVGWVGPSTEICDGVDNDCDGTVDDNVAGVGQPCGKTQGPCTAGTTACVNGALTCSGGTQPTPEKCDGIDNDCNGAVDDGTLADAPAAGMNGCWDLPTSGCATPCSFPATNPTLFWCAPAGGDCYDNGSLMGACNHGTLACTGGAWTCKNPKDPSPEVCDGIDNDCDGTVDNGVMNVGEACGSNVGECKEGMLQCSGGVLTCVGGVSPAAEACDGKDNDCDGVIDNGIVTGGSCTVPFDPVQYPGDRTKGACKPGVSQCDGNGGVVCIGGVGPSPEVCDGVDNDCDGKIDEVGNAPDGINGSANPLPPPDGNIGDACGVNQGECTQGTYTCLNGQFTCTGGTGAQPEECDCKDNDCDGTVDNQTPNGPPICGNGKDCIKSSLGCGCAAPCDLTKEFPCPGGQVCQEAMDSNGNPKGKYCVQDPCPGGCASKTVTDANGKVICAPAGTAADPVTCVAPPVCVCNGQNGCKNPCAGVTCGTGSVCTDYGPNAGKCVPDNCFANPCQGCDKVCNLGSCVQNPCDPNPCKADEVCKPSADLSSQTCVPSCAGVECPAGKQCVDGACVDGCEPACPTGQACDRSQSPPTCVTSKCDPNPCTDGSFCDPATGACGNDPCAGVVCPMGQACQDGSCFTGQGGAGGGSSSSSSGATSTSSGGTGTGGGGGNGGSNAKGVWGLATGGGGCSCEVGPGVSSRLSDGRWALVALALALGARRRKPRRAAGAEVSR